ncbi:MBL fold metallo-hydrolase RNA specificity domain-containing protein [Noviherbaspirillum massiliense]|uniref:MBL fold metallo-hydrolase RNA specificity domain-containing protein n=1 Tax=Noviherbaspirillum massiliense TaxID=1465823 RepID=UPI0002E33FD1|nr:MBL fold metallo-hydrolase [Noviherbaspirillum massiliense]
MHIRFLGATGTVTGSKYLVSSGPVRILLDCGLFQGYKELRLRNWAPLPVHLADIDAVVLTHAHLDHSGYLPLLVKNGFRGKIHCSEATYDLCKILLTDSGHLQEEEAAYANRHGFSKHHPALPLYTKADALEALKYFSPVRFGTRFKVSGDVHARLEVAGHILGAAIVALDDGKTSITFSGDLGRPDDPIMPAPAAIQKTDYLVVESTYGNRRHDSTDPTELLGQAICETASRGGVTVIPSFAVGRAQELMYYIHRLKDKGKIPAHLPVYLDSPMAINATEIYHRHRRDHRLDDEECRAMCNAAKLVRTADESIALNRQHMPMVIIAANGMATGGRVLHHLKLYAPDRRNTILFAGFQAGGTRGASMIAGAEAVKIHGEYIPVRAQVRQIGNLSAHADADEILGWLSGFAAPPKRVFIIHGEPDAANALRERIEQRFGWACSVPAYLDEVTLS